MGPLKMLELVGMIFHLHFFLIEMEHGRGWPIYITIWCALFAVLFGMFMRYIRVMNRTRKLDADVMLINKISRHMNLLQPLYKQFCTDEFVINVGTLPPKLENNLCILARDLSRVGALLQSMIVERQKRNDPSWMWPLQYFAISSLKFRLTLPDPEIRIYDPDNASSYKIYSREYLLTTLRKLQHELGKIRPRPWRRYIYHLPGIGRG